MTGLGCTSQSAPLSLVSSQLPSAPPGRRSMLARAGGAGATEPSTNEFVAVPQPTASTTDPPTYLRTREPPSAAMPLEYVTSASGPYIPAPLATRRCCPGASGNGDVKLALRVIVDPEAVT